MAKKKVVQERIAGFIESMECLPVSKVPEGSSGPTS